MTTAELKNTLNHGIAILQDNKQFVTPELLAAIEKIIVDLSGLTLITPINLSLNGNLQDVLGGISKVVDIEKRLVESTLTDNMIEIMTKIQNHPIILAMIAHIL